MANSFLGIIAYRIFFSNSSKKRKKLWKKFFARAKRTAKIFDPVEAVFSMKLLSPGCTLVTLRSVTKWYMSTPEQTGLERNEDRKLESRKKRDKKLFIVYQR